MKNYKTPELVYLTTTSNEAILADNMGDINAGDLKFGSVANDNEPW